MIQSIQISKLRGILEGSLEGLTPLTVLVGPNSSGKSTVLDAILIGASRAPTAAVEQALGHRFKVFDGARWLVWRGGEEGAASIEVTMRGASDAEAIRETITLSFAGQSEADGALGTSLSLRRAARGRLLGGRLVFDSANKLVEWEEELSGPLSRNEISEVRLVSPWSMSAVLGLVDLYSEAKRQGRTESVTAAARSIVPDCRGIEVLTERGTPLVHFDRGDKSLQLGLEGDGIQSLVRLALEMAARPRGIVLLEEPETHQHPATLVTTAKVIVAAVQREIQVVLATHSLELIDALVAALGDDESQLAKLSVVSLRLDDGRLVSSRLDGPSVASARDNIAMELR